MKRIQSVLRIPDSLNLTLINAAKQRGFSKNALILQILRNWADTNGLKPTLPAEDIDPAQLQIETCDSLPP